MKYWVLIGLDEILKFGFHKCRIYSLCLLPEPWDYDQAGQHMDLVISHQKVVKILAPVEVSGTNTRVPEEEGLMIVIR